MKKLALVLVLCLAFFACKNNKQEANLEDNRAKSYDANDGYITMKGEFVYDADQNAAVFETPNGMIYGVVVDDNMHKLEAKVKPLKANKFTSVPTTVRVRKVENPDPNILWDHVLEIKEVLNVEAPDPNKEDVIKLSNQ